MAADTQAIKDKIDIVDFIGEYVQLKPAGVNHKGLCPFHREKSPSFMVSRERQNWHCFGCSKGGDIFSFLQEIENMEFVEALRFLANRAGIVIDTFKTDIDKSQKNRLKELNKEAARFFHNVLLKLPASQKAREYVQTRGLSAETIESWNIGFIPDQWDLLTQYLLKKGFSIDDLVSSGLTIKRDGADPRTGRGFYDRFRGRIMFPIWDIYGDVVGFTGRVLVETETSGGKYVNTPQTLIYDKSRVVFGLNFAKQEIKSSDRIVVVEGQMDVIACHQAGMKYVIATSGTAFTEEQITLLKRYSTNMYIAFDADAAGQAAAKRGIDLAREAGMRVKIISIPDGAGKDPDECIQKNKAVWFESVEKARDIMEWYFEGAFKGKNRNDPYERQKIAETLVGEIMKNPYPLERDFWLHELSSQLSVGIDVLKEQVEVTRRKNTLKPGIVRASAEEDAEIRPAAIVAETRLDKLLERLILLFLRFPKSVDQRAFVVSHESIKSSVFAPIYEFLRIEYTTSNIFDTTEIRSHCDPNLKDYFEILLLRAEQEFFDSSESDAVLDMQNIIGQIFSEEKKEKRRILQEQLTAAEKKGDQQEIQRLMGLFQKL